MQIVINLNDDIAHGIIDGNKDEPRNIVRAFQATIAAAIQEGVPLPKGHDRLIILSEEKLKEEQTTFSFSSQDWIGNVGLSNATVEIIEVNE